MDILYGDLEAVEAPGLRHLHFRTESLHLCVCVCMYVQECESSAERTQSQHMCRNVSLVQRGLNRSMENGYCTYQVLIDNPVTGSKEGQNMFDKMLFLSLKKKKNDSDGIIVHRLPNMQWPERQ